MFSKTLLCLCCLWLPLSAQDLKSPQPNDEVPFWSGMEGPQLFYQLPPAPIGQEVQLHFRISVNGQAFAAEILTFEKVTGGESVELLALQPGLLKQLYEFDQQGNTVTVTAIFDGSKEWLPWAGLVSYNQFLKSDRSFVPVAPSERMAMILFDEPLQKTKPTGSFSATCQQNCYTSYEICAEYECGSPVVFCDPCLEYLADCLTNCCQATSTTFSRTTILSTVVDGTACLSPSYPNTSTGQIYQIKRRNYKQETIRRDTDTFCNTTDTVLSTSYYSKLCDVNTYAGCNSPTGKPTCNW